MTRVAELRTNRGGHRRPAVISGPGVCERSATSVEPVHSLEPSFGGDHPTVRVVLHDTDRRVSDHRKDDVQSAQAQDDGQGDTEKNREAVEYMYAPP